MRLQDTLWAVAASLIWSSAFVLVKFGLNDMPPFLFGGSRFILAGLMLLPFINSPYRAFCEIRRNLRLVVFTSLFQTVLLYGLFFVAMQYVRGAQASIIIGSSPVVSAIVAHFMQKNDKMTVRTTLSMLLGVVGVAVITLSSKPWSGNGSIAEFAGILLLLIGSVSSAVANVLVSNSRGAVNPITLNSIQMSAGGVILLLTGLLSEKVPAFPLPSGFWWVLAGLAFISAAGFSIWFHLLKHVKVSKLNTWKFLIPVGGSILSWCFLPDESPDITSVTGIILVCSAIFLCQRPEKQMPEQS